MCQIKTTQWQIAKSKKVFLVTMKGFIQWELPAKWWRNAFKNKNVRKPDQHLTLEWKKNPNHNVTNSFIWSDIWPKNFNIFHGSKSPIWSRNSKKNFKTETPVEIQCQLSLFAAPIPPEVRWFCLKNLNPITLWNDQWKIKVWILFTEWNNRRFHKSKCEKKQKLKV